MDVSKTTKTTASFSAGHHPNCTTGHRLFTGFRDHSGGDDDVSWRDGGGRHHCYRCDARSQLKQSRTFVDRHPTVKMLALSFLLMIGVTLIGDALEFHIPKGYVYFAMGFSVFVEMLNLRVRKRASRVRKHAPQTRTAET